MVDHVKNAAPSSESPSIHDGHSSTHVKSFQGLEFCVLLSLPLLTNTGSPVRPPDFPEISVSRIAIVPTALGEAVQSWRDDVFPLQQQKSDRPTRLAAPSSGTKPGNARHCEHCESVNSDLPCSTMSTSTTGLHVIFSTPPAYCQVLH